MSILDNMAALVRQAGQIVLSARDIWSHTHEKTSAADLVTEYDEAVEAFLKERLPKYMLPGQFIRLEALPHNANGKIDRVRLKEMYVHETGAG